MTITCLKLAQKICGGKRIKIIHYKDLYEYKGTYPDLKEDCAEIESKICQALNFTLPD